MLRVLKWVLAAGAAIIAVGWAITFFGPPGLVPSLLGTGGFVSKKVVTVPHAFAFDRPRFWNDRTEDMREMSRSERTWNILIQGPQTDVGVTFASLSVNIRPDSVRAAEFPVPGGPYVSLEDFTNRHLPSDRKVITDATSVVDGRPARDVTYDYVFYGAPRRPPPTPGVNFRSRAVIFEDRGYYYLIAYEARDVEYGRYTEVFDHATQTFRFLD